MGIETNDSSLTKPGDRPVAAGIISGDSTPGRIHSCSPQGATALRV